MQTATIAALLTLTLVTTALAEDQTTSDLAKFRAAYTSGDGLSYVVINDAKGEHVYRYGDASRLAAKKNPRGYVLFTCNAPHVFIPDDERDRAALAKAAVVKADDQRFAELAAKCLASCHNPLVKSAIVKNRRSSQ